MKTLRSLLAWVYEDFAPIVVFLGAEHLFDLRGAIMATLVFVLADVVGRLARGKRIDRLYWFSFASTMAFGATDLLLPSPVLFRYESVATNLLTAAFFAGTLLRGKPLVQELAEKTMSEQKKGRPDVIDYLRLLTMAWVGYFLVKATLYAYVAHYYTLDEAIAFRSIFGPVSLGAMFLVERTLRPHLFPLLRRLGYLTALSAPATATV